MQSLRNIERDTDGAKLAGVCAAIGDRWNVDPLLVRAGFCILGLSNGIGLVLYGAAWLMWPRRGGIAPIDQVFPSARRLPKLFQWGGLAIVCVTVMTSLSSFTPFGVGPAVVIGLVWWFGLRRQHKARQRSQRSSQPQSSPQQAAGLVRRENVSSSAFEDASARWQVRVAQHQWMKEQHRNRSLETGLDPTRQPYGADLWADGGEQGHRPYGGPNAARPAAQPPRPSSSAPLTGAGPAPRRNPPMQPTAYPEPAPQTAEYQNAGYQNVEYQDAGYRPTTSDPSHAEALEPAEVSPNAAVATVDDGRPLRRRRVWPWVLLASVMALVVAWVASRATGAPAVVYPAAVLAVIGVSLMLCTRRGRPRGLLAAGIVMILITAATATVSPEHSAPRFEITNANVGQAVHYEVGTVTEDLRDVTITQDTERRVNLEVGQLVLLLPPDTNVNVHWEVEAGSFHARPDSGPETIRNAGTDLRDTTRIVGSDPDGPVLDLYVHVDVGDLEVRQ